MEQLSRRAALKKGKEITLQYELMLYDVLTDEQIDELFLLSFKELPKILEICKENVEKSESDENILYYVTFRNKLYKIESDFFTSLCE